MARTFTYDLIQCEERTWHSWENFTETLTQDFQSYRQSNPDDPVKIIFSYTCEGTMWLVDGSHFYKAIHDFGKKYNVKLSQNRAESVRDYLLGKGIKSSRIEARGFGFDQPLVPNDSDINRAKNRRVEFKILKAE